MRHVTAFAIMLGAVAGASGIKSLAPPDASAR